MAPRWDWIALGSTGLALAVALQARERKALLQDEKERLSLQLADLRSKESKFAEARKHLVQLRALALVERLCDEPTLCQPGSLGSARHGTSGDAATSSWLWWRRGHQRRRAQPTEPQQVPEASKGHPGDAASSTRGDNATLPAEDSSLTDGASSLPWFPVLLDWYEQIERDAPEWSRHLSKRSSSGASQHSTQSSGIVV
jgi:hypothetical protein